MIGHSSGSACCGCRGSFFGKALNSQIHCIALLTMFVLLSLIHLNCPSSINIWLPVVHRRVKILNHLFTTTKYQVTLLYSIFMSALFFGCSTQYMLGPCTMRWVVCCSEPIPQFLNCLNMWKKIEPYFHPGTFSFPDISQDVHVERSLMNGVKCGHYFNQQLIKSARLQEANKKKNTYV